MNPLGIKFYENDKYRVFRSEKLMPAAFDGLGYVGEVLEFQKSDKVYLEIQIKKLYSGLNQTIKVIAAKFYITT